MSEIKYWRIETTSAGSPFHNAHPDGDVVRRVDYESLERQLADVRQSLQRAEGERDEALGLLSVAKCPNCDGGGATISVTNHTIPRCCGRFLPTGECCGQAEPECVPEQYLEQCEWCARKSGLLPLPASDGGVGG